ncbi:MAG: hypothetical protein PGN09_05750 [Sphingomonas fennica]
MGVARFGLGLAACGAAVGGAALAQESPRSPDIVPSREQVQPPAPRASDAPPPRVRVDGSRTATAAPCPLDALDIRADLRTIRFVAADARPLPAEIVRTLAGVTVAAPGEQPIGAVCTVRDRATEALRRAGYIASVQIPPQEISGGELQLQVVLARITEVRVRGEPGHYRDALLQRIAQLKALDPLNEHDAERILLLAGDIPGLDVQLSLRPAGTTPGAVIGDLTIVRRRFTMLANLQNYGSTQLGRETGYLRGELYGLLTPTDIAYAGVSATAQSREQRVAQGGYITGLGSGGLTVGGRINYAWSRPDLGLLDLRSRSLIAGIDIALPLYRSVNRSLSVAAGGEIIEQRTRVYGSPLGSAPLNRDKLRIAFLRATGNARARRADGRDMFALAGVVEIRRGLGILNATPRGAAASPSGYIPSRFGADPQAFVARAIVDGQAFAGPFSVATSARGQWANNPLLNFEEFAIGNLSVGRGYDPGSNSADRAIGFANELRVALPLSRRVPIQLFGFGDIVWLRNLDQSTTERKRRLRSAGGGARVTLPGRMVLEMAYAHAFDRALTFADRPPPDRVLLSLTAQFAPQAR